MAPVAPASANADADPGVSVTLEKMARPLRVALGGRPKLTRLPPTPQIGPESMGPQSVAPVVP